VLAHFPDRVNASEVLNGRGNAGALSWSVWLKYGTYSENAMAECYYSSCQTFLRGRLDRLSQDTCIDRARIESAENATVKPGVRRLRTVCPTSIKVFAFMTSKPPLDVEQFKARIQASQSLAKSLVASWFTDTSDPSSTSLKTQNNAKSKSAKVEEDDWAPEKTARQPGVGLGAKPDPKGTILQKSKQEEKLYRQLTGRKPDRNFNSAPAGQSHESAQNNGNGASETTGLQHGQGKKGNKRKKDIRQSEEEDSRFSATTSKKVKTTGDPLNEYLKKR